MMVHNWPTYITYHHLVQESCGLGVLLLWDGTVGEDRGKESGVVDPQAILVVLEPWQLCNHLRYYVHHFSISYHTAQGEKYVHNNVICTCVLHIMYVDTDYVCTTYKGLLHTYLPGFGETMSNWHS